MWLNGKFESLTSFLKIFFIVLIASFEAIINIAGKYYRFMRDLKIGSIYVVNDIITSPHKATAKLREGKQFGRQQVSGIAGFQCHAIQNRSK